MSEFPALKGNGCAPIFRPPKSVEEMGVSLDSDPPKEWRKWVCPWIPTPKSVEEMGVPLDSDPPKSVEEMGVPLDLWGNMSGLSGFTGGGRRWG